MTQEEIGRLCQELSAYLATQQAALRAYYAQRFASGNTAPDDGFRPPKMAKREPSGLGGYSLRVRSVRYDPSLLRIYFRASDDIFLPLAMFFLDTYGEHGAVAGNNTLELNIRVPGQKPRSRPVCHAKRSEVNQI